MPRPAFICRPARAQDVAGLLQCDANTLGRALITKRIKAGSEFIDSPVSAQAASDVRDGLAKVHPHKCLECSHGSCNLYVDLRHAI